MTNTQLLIQAQRELIKKQDKLIVFCSGQSRYNALDPELIWRKYTIVLPYLKKKLV